MRLIRRIAGAVALVIGLIIVVRGATVFSPRRAERGDKLIGLVEGELTDKGLADHQFDLTTWDRAAAQLQYETIPYLAQRTGADAQAFTARLRQQVPEVDAAVTTLPGALPFAHKILDNLATQQDNFRAAKDLPGPGISLRTGSWLLLLVGVLVMGLGLTMMLVDRALPAVALVVVGVLLIGGPLAVDFDTKADKTADLLATLNFDREVAARTRRFFEVTRDLFASVDTRIVPLAAAAGHLDPPALRTEIRQRFTDLAAALDHQDVVAARFEARVKIREQAVDSLNDVKKAPLRSLARDIEVAGVLVLAAGLVGLAALARERRVVTARAPAPA